MIAPGTLLQNRYLVERRIGEGGMGAVYVATDQRFGSTVALKETFFSDPSLRRAFEREARLLNHLRHPALPRVSDHFNEGEGQFLVMEYIPGSDLSEMLKARGAGFPLREVLAWADQLLDALDYLHTQETPVVHRDIKPQNLKLTSRGQIVLLDFGLAKGTPLQTRVTNTGSVFGYSVNYAPLEQMQGVGTDPRSDIYSLGATLYHLITNATPPDALTRASAVLNEQADPLRPASELDARVPAELADALARSMRQSAAQRFASAQEMRDALRHARDFVGEEPDAVATTTPAAAGSSEQETRLMGAPLGPTPTVPPGARGLETGLNSSPDAATLVNTQVTSGDARAATTHEPSAGASVVTKVRFAGPAAGGRRTSRRAVGVVASLVVVALIGAAVYSLTRREQTPAPADRLTISPAPQTQNADTPAQQEQPQQPAAPAPTQEQQAVEPAPADAPRRPEATAPAKPAPTKQSGGGERVMPPSPDAPDARPETPEPPPDPRTDPESPFRNRDWRTNPPTQEEREEYIRRRVEERRRRLQRRRRVIAPRPPYQP